MNTKRAGPAYSLEIVVSDSHVTEVSRVAAAMPGPVTVRDGNSPESGRSRLILSTDGEQNLEELQSQLRTTLESHLVYCEDRALACSRGGKTQTRATVSLDTAEDLALVYTPGVGRVSLRVAQDPERVNELTGRANRVAVVTERSAVLGLGNLGPWGALPVMEGKAALFAGLAGINLEDISAPRCFAVEERLRHSLDIPVMHDDQHWTATVVLAALLNALRVVGKSLSRARVVVVGAGAAGTAVTRILLAAGAADVVVWAPVGVLHPNLSSLLPAHKVWLARHTNPRRIQGGLAEALTNADAVIGVSAPGVLDRGLVQKMAGRPIVFALATPEPEIDPDDVSDIAVVATGRSDYPNQVNNALVFPGFFRGVLGSPATALTDDVFVASAHALAELTVHPHAERRLPDVFDPRVVPALAAAVKKTLSHPRARPVLPGRTSEASVAAAGDGHETDPRPTKGDSHG